MADFTKTISNSFRVQGPGVESVWGVMVWGVDFWGNTKDTRVLIGKYIADSFAVSDTVYFQPNHVVSNSIALSTRLNLGYLSDGSGWYYVLQGGVTDPDDRYFPSYVSQSGTSPVYVQQNPTNPGWTES